MYIRKVVKEIGGNGSDTSAQHFISTRDHSNIWSWQLTAPVDRGYRRAHLVHIAYIGTHTYTGMHASKPQGHIMTLFLSS